MGVQINVPDGVKLSHFELSMHLAARLFERGIISSGQGAEMVGLSKGAFIEILGKYGVSIFQYDMDELLEDIDNVYQ
ncbi:MAG: UPF0175 family protein [Bacteroidota bacterium]